VGFGGFLATSEAAEDDNLPLEVKMAMRKMAKKDAITKIKVKDPLKEFVYERACLQATQELSESLKGAEDANLSVFLPFWPRIYVKVANDVDPKVREAVQKAHLQGKRPKAFILQMRASSSFKRAALVVNLTISRLRLR